jgi:hypothetical protein
MGDRREFGSRKGSFLGSALSLVLLIGLSACSFDPPLDPSDLRLTSGDSPVIIASVCALAAVSDTPDPATAEPQEPCIALDRPIQVAFAPLPVLSEATPESPFDELAIVGCLSGATTTHLGLIPTRLIPDSQNPRGIEDICDLLPGIDADYSGGDLAASAWATVTSNLGKDFESCSRELRATPDGTNRGPVRGPETIGNTALIVGGVAVGEGLLKGWIDKLSPTEKYGAGLVLLIVAAPIVGGVILASAPGAVLTGATIVLGVVLKVGVQSVVAGTAPKKGGGATAPAKPPPSAAPQPVPSDAPQPAPSDAPIPAPNPSQGGRPAPTEDELPDSCLDALVRAVSCLGQSDQCEDPDTAAALAAAREAECQKQKVLTNPESEFCSTRVLTEDEIAGALVRLCAAAAAVGQPDPEGPVCPLMQSAGSGSYARSIPDICLRVVGENGAVECPQMADPTVDVPKPDCPIGPVPVAGKCEDPPGPD